MRRTRVLLALTAALTAAASVPASPAQAFPHSIQVAQTNTDKVVTRTYREWGSARSVAKTNYAFGKVKVRVTPFRIKEDIRGRDQYVLDVEVRPFDRRTGSAVAKSLGYVDVYLKARGATVVKSSAVKTGKTGSCSQPIKIGLNASFGPLSASSDVAELKSCPQGGVKLQRAESAGGLAAWRVHGLAVVQLATLDLFVEVPAGKVPNWDVYLETPVDGCDPQPEISENSCKPRRATSSTSFRYATQG